MDKNIRAATALLASDLLLSALPSCAVNKGGSTADSPPGW